MKQLLKEWKQYLNEANDNWWVEIYQYVLSQDLSKKPRFIVYKGQDLFLYYSEKTNKLDAIYDSNNNSIFLTAEQKVWQVKNRDNNAETIIQYRDNQQPTRKSIEKSNITKYYDFRNGNWAKRSIQQLDQNGTGYWTIFDDDGNISITRPYVKHDLHGQMREFIDGKLYRTSQWINNHRHGPYYEYHEDHEIVAYNYFINDIPLFDIGYSYYNKKPMKMAAQIIDVIHELGQYETEEEYKEEAAEFLDIKYMFGMLKKDKAITDAGEQYIGKILDNLAYNEFQEEIIHADYEDKAPKITGRQLQRQQNKKKI